MTPPENRPYEKPQIIKHFAGYMNKFGRGSLRSSVKDIDQVPVRTLAEKFGTPLFVISETILLRKFHEIQNAFTHRYPRVVMAWSYKTNYLKAVCASLQGAGAWAEVVSGLEYEMARALGVPGPKIIYNGPLKSEASLKRAIQEGARIHIDHFDELSALDKLASAAGRKLPVGVRVNLDAGILPMWDRFGFNVESGQAREAVRRVRDSASLELKGLHCHIGTFIFDPQAYRRAAEKIVDLARTIQRDFGIKLDWIDMGGGMASRNTLRSSYLSGEHVTPPVDEYAACLTEALLTGFGGAQEAPLLFLEYGRAIVDEAGFLLTSVVASKRLPSGKRALVVDAGLNNLFTALWYKHELALTEDTASLMEETAVFGPLCMGIDVVRESILLPPLGRGDLLVIKNVGAYNMTQWMQFIHERPAVVFISESGEVDLIRERETLSYITSLEHLPAKFTRPS